MDTNTAMRWSALKALDKTAAKHKPQRIQPVAGFEPGTCRFATKHTTTELTGLHVIFLGTSEHQIFMRLRCCSLWEMTYIKFSWYGDWWCLLKGIVWWKQSQGRSRNPYILLVIKYAQRTLLTLGGVYEIISLRPPSPKVPWYQLRNLIWIFG